MTTAVGTSDAELLHRLRQRDRSAWEELYAVHQPRLRAFAYRLAGNVHDADDLVQETFVRALPRLDRLDPDTADVGAYLFGTLKNLFLKQVERGKRQQPTAEVPEPTEPVHIDDDPARSTLLKRQQDEVRIANARLDSRQRLVLALRELEDRSYAEIAEIVGLKENAVAQLIFRARESLRFELRLAQVNPELLPEECRRFLPLLARHLDGELDGRRRDETLAHLDGCERCQAALADMKEAERRYRTLLLPLGGADEARAATEERLELVGYWQERSGGRLGRRARGAVLLAAALVLGGGGAALGVGLSRDRPPPVSKAATGVPTSTPPTSSAPTPPSSSELVAGTEVTITTPLPTDSEPEASPEPSPQPSPDPAPAPAPTPTTTTTSTTTTVAATVPTPTAPQKPKQPAPKPETVPDPKPGDDPAPPPARPPTKPPPAPDTAAPIVTITSAPARESQTASARIRFRANETGVTFRCKLDGGVYAVCSSPKLVAGLAPGQHTFSVRATDKAGNVGKAASVTWTYTEPDTVAPTVTITSAPSGSTTDTSASFAFAADDLAATFACSLDGGAFALCSSPVSYTGLPIGAHTFTVRATDPAGNLSADAVASWEIVAPAPPPPPPLPDLVVASLTKYAIVVTNRGNAEAAASVLTITLIGTFTVPALAPGASATFTWSICRVGTYSAIVDRTKVVAESDENNNTAAIANTCP